MIKGSRVKLIFLGKSGSGEPTGVVDGQQVDIPVPAKNRQEPNSSAKKLKLWFTFGCLWWMLRTRTQVVNVLTGVTQEGSWSRAMVVPG